MKKFLAILVLWAAILGGGGAAYYFIVIKAEEGNQTGTVVRSFGDVRRPRAARVSESWAMPASRGCERRPFRRLLD